MKARQKQLLAVKRNNSETRNDGKNLHEYAVETRDDPNSGFVSALGVVLPTGRIWNWRKKPARQPIGETRNHGKK